MKGTSRERANLKVVRRVRSMSGRFERTGQYKGLEIKDWGRMSGLSGVISTPLRDAHAHEGAF